MNNQNIIINTEYEDPEKRDIEIVERKGLGHPDSLANGIANFISILYGKYCLQNFGHILHHNLDKVYIGGGMFLSKFGKTKIVEPIKIVTNGRMSNQFGKKKIDIQTIQLNAIKEYLSKILPNLDIKKHLKIITNATQNTPNLNHPHWFCPRGERDLPELKRLSANDTSVSVAHFPMTFLENLVYQLEQSFWLNDNNKIRFNPKFKDYGQDIKVMGFRRKNDIEITMCVPIIAKSVRSMDEYNKKVRHIQKKLNFFAKNMARQNSYNINVRVNPSPNGKTPKVYILGIGSCIEGGEEGVVGRGNDNNGVISIFRFHSQETEFGKNPVYHTGKVMGYLTKKLAQSINKKLGVKCTVISLTKNQFSLIPPSNLIINLDKKIDDEQIFKVIKKDFLYTNYVKEILDCGFR